MKYEIQCGIIDEVIEAKSHEIGFRKLVKKYKPKWLGLLMRFRELDCFNRPIRNLNDKVRDKKNKDIGKWKYQNPLAILNLKSAK